MLIKKNVLQLRSLAPKLSVINMYGSTETQRSVGYLEVPPPRLAPPPTAPPPTPSSTRSAPTRTSSSKPRRCVALYVDPVDP